MSSDHRLIYEEVDVTNDPAMMAENGRLKSELEKALAQVAVLRTVLARIASGEESVPGLRPEFYGHATKLAVDALADSTTEAHALLDRLQRAEGVGEALRLLIRHHNTEDCEWRGGTDEACLVAAQGRQALAAWEEGMA